MKPQIYNATTKFHGKIRLQELARSRNVQEPTGSPTGSPAGDPERDSAGVLEKHPDNMFKVIIFFSRSTAQDSAFDGAEYQEVGLG